MKRSTLAGLTLALVALAMAGCPHMGADDNHSDVPPAVMRSLNASGGMGLWSNVRKTNGQAVLTVHAEGHGAYVTNIRFRADLAKGTLQADAYGGQGLWTATVDRFGRGDFRQTDDGVIPVDPNRITGALGAMVHRLYGPMNLVSGLDLPGGSESALVDGRSLVRVEVTKSPLDIKAYYFSQSNDLLQLITEGGDARGESGSVTLYENYQKLPCGRTWPMTIRAVGIGQYVLLSDKPLWEIELTRVKIP
jgi:hypothetical protein